VDTLLQRQHEIEQFLFHEARLLDEQRWDEWLDLFEPEGMYWAPLVRGQDDALNHASLLWEDATLREVRVRRLGQRTAWSQQPASHTAHLVGNVILEHDGDPLVVRSTFHVTEWNRRGQRLLAGAYTHRLRRAAVGFKIMLKRVDLINCAAVHDNLEVFI